MNLTMKERLKGTAALMRWGILEACIYLLHWLIHLLDSVEAIVRKLNLTVNERLKGTAALMRRGIFEACLYVLQWLIHLLDSVEAIVRKPYRIGKWICQRGYSQIDGQLSRRGTPVELRSTLGFVLGAPSVVVRIVLLVVVLLLWVCLAPQVAVRTWNAIKIAETHPNKRTPKKSRPWQRLDDFDDVRVRVSELKQYPKQ